MWEATIDLKAGRRLFRKVVRGTIGDEPVELTPDLLDEASYSGKIGGNPFLLARQEDDDGVTWSGTITDRPFSFPDGAAISGEMADRPLTLKTGDDALDVQLGADVLTIRTESSEAQVEGLARYERLQRPRAGDGPPLPPLSTGQIAAIVVAVLLSRPDSPLPQ